MEFRPEYWSGYFSSPGGLPNSGMEPRSPTLQADSSPSEPQGKPKNTGVGSLFLPQGMFPTQELNWDLLHCRWILYQLSYHKPDSVLKTRDITLLAKCPYSQSYGFSSSHYIFESWTTKKAEEFLLLNCVAGEDS